MFVFSVATYDEYENREEVTYVSTESSEISVLEEYAEWRDLADIVFGKKRSVILSMTKISASLADLQLVRKRLGWNDLDSIITEIKRKYNLR